MKPRSQKATKDEQARYDALKELGCIVGRLRVVGCVGCEIQHLTSGGRRISNYHTIPLCPWHHRGQLPEGFTTTKATLCYGPSFAKSRKQFEQIFGSEEYLLEQTNRLLDA